ncbi:MAG: curli production assembly protein CsgG [Deltaproteobacteria bacterium]|nr:curli production assembly protein CsgG [Deltaproteobacteria bacterium]
MIANEEGIVRASLQRGFVLGLAALAAACSPTRTISEGVADRGPAVAAAPLPEAERMQIAIGRFTNESSYGAGLFTDESGDRLGKQASDLLSNHLVETQRFVVVERPDLGRLRAEAKLMGLSEEDFRKNLKGVDALILGSIAELGRETTGRSWFFGRSKQQRARARVVLRLADPRTGEIFYTQEGSGDATIEAASTLGFGGSAGWDSTLDGKAIDAAIVNMLNNVVRTLDARRPLKGAAR